MGCTSRNAPIVVGELVHIENFVIQNQNIACRRTHCCDSASQRSDVRGTGHDRNRQTPTPEPRRRTRRLARQSGASHLTAHPACLPDRVACNHQAETPQHS
jgi:hypothetical protein